MTPMTKLPRAGSSGAGSVFVGLLLLVVSSGFAASSVAAVNDLRLVEAVRRGHMDVARDLVKQRADVNTPQPDGTTPLHWAVERSDKDMVSLLVGAGAKTNRANTFGVTPLSLACTNGDAAIVSILLRAGADPNTALRTGETPLMTAARTGRVEAVNVLIEAGGDVKAKEPLAGQTALMWAIAEGHTDVAEVLIEAGASVHEASKRGFTPLLFAARNGDVGMTKLLVSAGVDVNEPSRDGTTALVIATIRSHVAYAKFLLDLGADPKKGPGFTPLHWVAGDWNSELAGDKTAVRPEGTEWDRLLPLRGQARLDYIKMLLDYGANVNARAQSTPRATVGTGAPRGPAPGAGVGPRSAGGTVGADRMIGATPFFIAAQEADVPLMRFLLAEGADPLIRTERNVSPLMAAAGLDAGESIGYTGIAEHDALEAIKLCLDLGDDVHTVSTDGETALHGAGYRGNAGANQIAQLLLDRGIEVDVKNKRGWSPVTLAEGIYTANSNSKNPDLERLLLQHGGKPSPAGIERDAYAVIRDVPADK
jgi:uncharacterized protein